MGEWLSTERLGNFSAGENGFRQKDEVISVERKMAFDREMRLFQWSGELLSTEGLGNFSEGENDFRRRDEAISVEI